MGILGELSFRRQKLCYWLGAVSIVLVFLSALLVQFRYGLVPCHLCILQRLFLIVVAGLFLCCALLSSRKVLLQQVLMGVLLLFVLAGLLAGFYQMYLQWNPPAVTSCTLGGWEMFARLPLWEWLSFVFEGQPDCAKVQWDFLGFSTVQWLLVFYVMLFVFVLWLWRTLGVLKTRVL